MNVLPYGGLRIRTMSARTTTEEEFRRLVEPYRAELHAHCYRLLGSVHDAEDALQEAMLRAWRALPRFEGRSSLRAWLYRIATNTSLDLIERRPKRVLPVDYGPAGDPHDEVPLVESAWLEPYPDERLGVEDGLASPSARYELRESVELAFTAALQHLPATQRAVLILRDVLGYSARESAEMLDTTVHSVNSALRRARGAVARRLPPQSQQATLRALGDEAVRKTVERYMDALDRGDVDAIVGMLADDAAWSMPPCHEWFRGVDAIIGFLVDGPLRERWRHLPARANGQPAVGCYRWDEDRERYVATVLDVLTLDGARIAAVTAFVTPEIFPSFGLPKELAPGFGPSVSGAA
jgi:RNA polymerase sigma-70 factor (ECF subfamily)